MQISQTEAFSVIKKKNIEHKIYLINFKLREEIKFVGKGEIVKYCVLLKLFSM